MTPVARLRRSFATIAVMLVAIVTHDLHALVRALDLPLMRLSARWAVRARRRGR